MTQGQDGRAAARPTVASTCARGVAWLAGRLALLLRSESGSVPDDPTGAAPDSPAPQSQQHAGNDTETSASGAGGQHQNTGRISGFMGWATWFALISVALVKTLVSPAGRGRGKLSRSRADSSSAAGDQPRGSDQEVEEAAAEESSFPPAKVHPPTHVAAGTLLVALCLAVAFAGGIGFLVAYWSGGRNSLLGGALALFFGGFGCALVLWSHLLSTHIEVTEPRKPLAEPTPALEPALTALRRVDTVVQRRGILKGAAALGAGLFAAMFVSTLRSFSLSPDSTLYSTVWKRGQRLMNVDGKPVSVEALQPGSMTIVFPEDSIGSERSQTVLIRVRENLLRLPHQRQGWAPLGYLAYSRVCTHAGCPVGMYEATTHLLMCPCHQSTFNVLDGCQPTGGPAARPLPQLPIYADQQGFLRAAGGFSEPPGPGFWGMP